MSNVKDQKTPGRKHRKISPTHLEALINHSPIGVVVVGETYIIEYVNKALSDMLRYPADKLIGKDFRDLLTGESLTLTASRYQQRREGKSVPNNYRIHANRSDGEILHLDLTSTLSVDNDGSVKTIAQIIDITQQEATRTALEEFEIRYKTLVEHSPYAIVLADLEGRLITVNEKATEIFGYKSKSAMIKERQLLDYVLPEERRRSYLDSQRTIRRGAAGPFKYTFLREDGSTFNGEVSGVVIQGTEDVPDTYMAIVTDISERVAAEKELHENERFISAIADTSPAMIYVYDLLSSTQLYLNQAVEQHLGYSVEEALELINSPEDNLLHPDDVKMSAEHLQRLREDKTDRTHEIIFRLRHKDGAYRIVRSFERPFERGEDGQTTKLIGVSIDITEQEIAVGKYRETSERLSNIMRAANDGMWDWHLDSGKVIFDPRYYQMAGYEVDEFPHTLDEFQKRVHPDDLNEVMQRAQNHLEGISDRFKVEFRFLRKDDAYMWIMGRGIIVERGEDGSPKRLMGTHTDITELKKIQSDLRRAKNKAEESDRLKSAFLANMSHEIRTPMNGILGFADLLYNEDLNDHERREYIEIIQRSGLRMLNTINDIIDLSKIEAGQVDIHKSTGNLNNQMMYLYEFFLPEASFKNISLVKENGLDDKNAMVFADHEKLTAVFTNLLKNALKYTTSGSIHFGYAMNGEHLEFYVRDTGIGISKNRQKAIFERFVQEDLTITKPYEGSGLGLSISKGFVELMGGKIWVSSARGSGSEFRFTIPFETVKKPSNKANVTGSNENVAEKLKNLTVLVVEDDESALFFLNELLKKRCGKILEARHGMEAVEICKKHPDIDLVMMDIKMPELDGYEATKEIRKFNKEVIIIGQTAYALLGDKKKVIQAGCNDYITKPIDRNELFNKIQKFF